MIFCIYYYIKFHKKQKTNLFKIGIKKKTINGYLKFSHISLNYM